MQPPSQCLDSSVTVPWGVASLGMLTNKGSDHAENQETKIDTTGYALHDSPAVKDTSLACACARPAAECSQIRACTQSSAVHVQAPARESHKMQLHPCTQ